jgi:hypothetical protein
MLAVSPGPRASAIDAVGNSVLISGLRIEDAPRALLPGRYPLNALPALLHETTHFDTFQSPVGHAIATLYLRAFARLGPSGEGSYEGLRDFVCFKVANALLLPIAEGMALFSEFDSVPRQSPVTTPMTRIASSMFGGDSLENDSDMSVGDLAYGVLMNARRQHFMEARKENVVTQPMGTQHGGYLPGYLLIRTIRQRQLRGGFARVVDGDLFYTIVKAVVFGDAKLARLLLEIEADEHAVNKVATRIQQRIRQLVDDVDEAYIDRIEEIFAPNRDVDWKEVGFAWEANQVRDDAAFVEQRITEIYDGEEMGEFADLNYRILRNRELLCLASFETTLKVTPAGQVAIGATEGADATFPTLIVPGMPSVTPGVRKGTFEIYLASRHQTVCFAAVADGAVLACGSRMAEAPPEIVELLRDVLPSREVFRLRDAMEAQLDGGYLQSATFGGLASHYLDQTPCLVQDAYLGIIRDLFTVLNAGELPDAIVDGGVLDECDLADMKVLSSYCALSLRYGGVFLTGEIEEGCAELNIDPQILLAWCDRWTARTHFPLATARGGATFFTL